jgi:hypothetical protein
MEERMGVCGCGDFNGDFKFPGPDGITYVLQVYPPCENCNTPAGVIIYSFNKDDCKNWDVDEIPELDFGNGEALIAVAHPGSIMKSVFEGLEHYLEEGVGDVFRSSVFDAIKDNRRYLTKKE